VGTGPHEAAISPDGKWGVVTIYGGQTPGNQLAVLDLAARKVIRTIDLGRFTRPHGALFLPGSNSVLAVTSEATQRVILVDIAQGRVLADIPTENALSHMLGITADGKRVYTANIRAGSISEIDVDKRAFTRQLVVATQTEGIAVRPDGAEVWVGSNDAGTVSVVDTKSWTVAATIGGFGMPYRIGISPNGALAVICDPKEDKIHIVDVATRKVLGSVGDLGAPRGVMIAPDNRTALVTVADARAVVAIDLVDRTVRARVAVESSPDGVAYSTVAPTAAAATPAPAPDQSGASGAEVLERMRAAYAGVWYRTLTFVQKTTVHRPDGTQSVSTWYESLRHTAAKGTQLRIDIGDPAAGDGMLYTADSTWVVRGGTLATTRGEGNEFLPLIEGVYMQPVARTIAELRATNVDLARVRTGRWRDRAVSVVGASSAADTTSPQFWVDAERNVVVRMILKPAPKTTMDITLDGYVPAGRGWLATKVVISVDGSPRQVEEYSDWKVDVDLPDALFDVATWSTAPHWAKR
jgi:YVTN family beta-propeller protein